MIKFIVIIGKDSNNCINSLKKEKQIYEEEFPLNDLSNYHLEKIKQKKEQKIKIMNIFDQNKIT